MTGSPAGRPGTETGPSTLDSGAADICAIVLAAGEGRRLRPLTDVLPKALCPVGNVALVDRALALVASLGWHGSRHVAVNAWYRADDIVAHIGRRAYVGVETGPVPLGSAGGLAALRDWIDGRHVLVGNSDAYLAGGDLTALLRDWDRTGPRILGVPASEGQREFGGARFAGFSLLPWRIVAALPVEPADLVRAVWRPAEVAGTLRVVDYRGEYIDSGTPADYLAANLHAARLAGDRAGSLIAPDAKITGSVRRSVVGARAIVEGRVERSLVWPEAHVGSSEHLRDVIRYGEAGTVDARRPR